MQLMHTKWIKCTKFKFDCCIRICIKSNKIQAKLISANVWSKIELQCNSFNKSISISRNIAVDIVLTCSNNSKFWYFDILLNNHKINTKFDTLKSRTSLPNAYMQIIPRSKGYVMCATSRTDACYFCELHYLLMSANKIIWKFPQTKKKLSRTDTIPLQSCII